MRLDLQKRLFLSFASIVMILSLLSSFVGIYMINRALVDEAQNRVRQKLYSAWAAYDREISNIQNILKMMATQEALHREIDAGHEKALSAFLEKVRQDYQWDFLSLTDPSGRVIARGRYPYNRGDDRSRDPLVSRALVRQVVSGTQIIPAGILDLEGENLRQTAFIVFEETPKAKRRAEMEESSGMALVAAMPVQSGEHLLGVLYGGILLNRRYALVDQVKDMVFRGEKYGDKDLGTVTIFQWDVRIATNVMKADGNRAIGTRISKDVYDLVLENGRSWQDRAFVVNDWYITAYDPIWDIDGRIAGVLYVGVLEAKYRDIRSNIVFAFLSISLLGGVLVLGMSYWLARHLALPIHDLVEGATALAQGDMDHRVGDVGRNDEIGDLTRAFDAMAHSLERRERELQKSNSELQTLNYNYLDMLSFVSHELKNTVGACLTNAYSLRDGILGAVTSVQQRALDGIARNLAYFEEMIKNYLDLSRIEKGEIMVEKRPLHLYADVVEPALHTFDRSIKEAGMEVSCAFEAQDIALSADPSLMRIAYNNLIENAVKYGRPGGKIALGATRQNGQFLLDVWNEGPGIPVEQMDRLFKKFSRLEGTESARKKGTGLGLFITREIVEKHGGHIWVESEENKWADFKFVLPES